MDSRERFGFRFGFGLDSDSDSSRNLLQPAATCYNLRQPAAICCNLRQSAADCEALVFCIHSLVLSFLVPSPSEFSFLLFHQHCFFLPPCSHTFHELRRTVSELCKNIFPGAHFSQIDSSFCPTPPRRSEIQAPSFSTRTFLVLPLPSRHAFLPFALPCPFLDQNFLSPCSINIAFSSPLLAHFP